ncbi:hypothetical protein GTP91_04105 [Rugamonas sp. FT82W]|uniref:Uncharacterized protein n=1 Tax=Duganella vulcania TaxID=2692166 RepID=A0A845FXR8_9BURK|nr:hypothetical protein [Duganella vulcania]MYM86361.1 hypothetical protein [Duganella vulcania]
MIVMTPWVEEIECEGGPVVFANAEDFLQWRGAKPFGSEQANELHYWSQFTSELPLEFQPDGPAGHQYISSANPAALRDQLMQTIESLWPGTTVDRRGVKWVATRPDGRKLNAELSPSSEYDRMIRHLDNEAVHVFADGRSAYFWSVAPGWVRIATDPQRGLVHLAQVEFADDEAAVADGYQYAQSQIFSSGEPGQRYCISGGPVVVAWSPNSADDLNEDILTAERDGKLLDMANSGSGARLWLEPGIYESALGNHETDSWGVAWCSLKRVGEC